jgi:hypothetical protein
VDFQRFYRQLFKPLEACLGPVDPDTIFAIIGFDAGGPLNFCTFGVSSGSPWIAYVSCELAVRTEQFPSPAGRYELLCTCDDETWVRSIVTLLGRMSLETVFGHGHTVDIGQCVSPDAVIQGVLLELALQVEINGTDYAVYRVIGITRPEMQFARRNGHDALVDKLSVAKIYPNTLVNRSSTV